MAGETQAASAPASIAPTMKALYTVHNPHQTLTGTQAIVKGEQMLATVDTFEVELIADDLSCGGIKLRFMGNDIDAAKQLFIADSKIVASFAAEG